MKKVFILIFVLLVFPALAKAGVVINEIAWMGNPESANNEWLELYNNGSEAVSLDDWTLSAQDGTPSINLAGNIPANGFFLLERTDDSTLADIAADLIYTGALSNSGEILSLKDQNGSEIDKVDASSGWIAGDNATKQTMQRTANGWITAISTPKASNETESSQSQETDQESQQSQTQASASSPSSSVSVQTQTIPQIKAYAGEDKNVITGAEVKFSGLALGLKGETIDNAAFLWTFGDGDFKEGRVVSHIYQFPGNYIAVLDISSGQYSASDRTLVKVNKAELLISEIKPEEAGWVEIKNKSKEELDISGLKIKQQSQSFSFPQSTFIKADSIIVVPESVSKIKLAKDGEVGLFYANSFPIDKFSYQGILKEGESFNRAGNAAGNYVAKETPGAENTPTPPISTSTSDVGIKTGKASIGKTLGVDEKTPSVKEAEAGIDISQSQKQEAQIEQQPAAVLKTEDKKTSNWLFWFLISLGIGTMGAIGFIIYRRKSKDEFKVE
ncbi:MAG: lamin tail domain-containing protein [Patescibacteria group bacterium]